MNRDCATQNQPHCFNGLFERLARHCLLLWGFFAIACICSNSQDLSRKQEAQYRIVYDNRSGYVDSGNTRLMTRPQDVDIYVMDTFGGGVKRLTSDHRSHSPAWSPDGKQIAFLQDESVSLPKESTSMKDRRFILDYAQRTFPAHRDLRLMSVNGADARKIASVGPGARDLLWLPNSDTIALRSSDRQNLKVCVAYGKQFGAKCDRLDTVEGIVENYRHAGEQWQAPFLNEYYPAVDNFLPTISVHWGNVEERTQAAKDNIRSIIPFFPDLAASLSLKLLDGASAEAPVPAYDAAWSSDGKRIAYSRFSDGHNSVLYIADMKDDHADSGRPLTEPALEAHSPAWSADGSRIAFSGFWKGTQQFFVIGADGSGLIQVSRNEARSCSHPSWSPDGALIVAECHDNIIFSGLGPNPYWGTLYIDLSGWDSSIYLFDMKRLDAAPRALIECPFWSPNLLPRYVV
jgi:dipeptidyl aminopeptidase/acylaminoacyl peptidase